MFKTDYICEDIRMNCTFDFYTDIGGRGNNEDSVLALSKDDCFLFAVADGLGGHDCGEVASKITVDVLRDHFMSSGVFDPAAAVSDANTAVVEEQRRTGRKMHSTVALAYVNPRKIALAHAGDTRVYVFRGGRILTRTVDHSASQLAVYAGEISPEQIRQHEDRNILTKVLGGSESINTEVFEIKWEPDDALLLCSDGFWEYVLENDMLEFLDTKQPPDIWLGKMRDVRRMRASEKSDNNTAVAAFLR